MRRLLYSPGAAVFALVFVAYAYFYQAGGWNQNSRFDLTRAIVEHRTLVIDRYEKNTGDEAKRDGHYYCDKAPGVSVLGVPAWALVHAIAAEPSRPSTLAVGAWLATVTAIALPSAFAVLALMLLCLRLGLSRERAAVVALGWGLATLAFPYSTVFYGHQLIAAAAVIAFLLVHGQTDASARRLLACGLVLGAAVAVEYTAALFAVPIAIYALAARTAPWWRILPMMAVGAAIPGALLAWYHAAAFGGPLTLPYEFSTQKHRHLGWFMGLGKPVPHVLEQITFSSYRGLFYSAPWLLLAVPGAVRWWRAGRRAEVAVAGSVIFLFLWLNASLVDWEGGWAMGPRYLVPAIPFLVLLAAGVLLPAAPGSWLARATADRRGVRLALGVLLGALLVGSMVLMLVGTSVKPEVPVHIKRPFADYLFPQFGRGELAVSTQGIDMAGNPAHGARQAWNLGHAIGLSGRASLVPLALAWAACAAWLGIALRGLARQPSRRGVTS